MKTKRGILGLFLALCVVWSMLPLGAFAEDENAGDEPTHISTAEDLRAINGNLDGDYVLDGDIDLTDYLGGGSWTPIGTENVPFTGTFDGNGHSITGLYINASDSNYQGLFGYVGPDGTVKNLTVSGSVSGSSYIGGVVGRNNGGTIENCHNTVAVSGSGYVGGVVGINLGGTVENCYNTGTVSSENSNADIGGVVGYLAEDKYIKGIVKNCYNAGTVNGSARNVGGVVGYINGGGTATNCYNTGNVSSESTENHWVGGVVGLNKANNLYENYVISCYYLKGTADIGIGQQGEGYDATKSLTAEDFAKEDSFPSDWDFASTWEMSELLGRPILQSNREGGSGTPDSPYEIPDLATLERARNLINEDTEGTTYRSASYVLTDDIDMSEEYGEGEGKDSWTPIGSFSNAFTGTFDGQGHSIRGLYIVNTSSPFSTHYPGLFGYVGEGTVKNLTISGNVSGAPMDSVGGVVGYNNGGTIENCKFEGSIRGGDYGGTVGGVVGENTNGTVKNCSNTGTVSGTGASAGGVVGENSGTVTNCHNNAGTVSGDDNPAGGVVGENSGTVENCSNTGKVSGTGGIQAPAGGVVGENDSGTVKNCSNTGTVSGTGEGGSAGGVVGWNIAGTVTNCSNTGEINGTGVPAGGVVGKNNSSTVENCSNTGTVSGSNNAGGVVGENRERHRRKLLQYRQGQRRGLCRWCGRRE